MIYPIISIVQLEPAKIDNPYNRTRSTELPTIIDEEGYDNVYEIERLINKRIIRRNKI